MVSTSVISDAAKLCSLWHFQHTELLRHWNCSRRKRVDRSVPAYMVKSTECRTQGTDTNVNDKDLLTMHQPRPISHKSPIAVKVACNKEPGMGWVGVQRGRRSPCKLPVNLKLLWRGWTMAQPSRALAAPADDPSLAYSTHIWKLTTAWNSRFQGMWCPRPPTLTTPHRDAWLKKKSQKQTKETPLRNEHY